MNRGVADAFAGLAGIVYARADYESVYKALVDTAHDLIPGCDYASISTKRGGEPLVVAAATHPIASQIDEYENVAGEGPCMDAILEASYQHDPDIADHSTWPMLAPLILEHTPVRGMIGYRIPVGGHTAAALDIFSRTPGALDRTSAETGAVLASFASVALVAAAHNERAGQLQEAVESNREIGKAIGYLMATHGVDEGEAFDILRRRSSELNIKLVKIARDVLADRD